MGRTGHNSALGRLVLKQLNKNNSINSNNSNNNINVSHTDIRTGVASDSVAAGSSKYGLEVTVPVPRALAGHGTLQNLLWDEDYTPHRIPPKILHTIRKLV